MGSDVPELLPDRNDNPGVIVERVELAGVDGPVTTLVHRPDRPGPHPAIALGAEATGVNEFLRRIAATLASRGFVTALPDYFRGGGPRDPDNYDDFDDILPHLDALDFTRATRDVALAADMLVHRPDVDPDRLGVWGYCTGATLALLAATVRSDVRAAVLFYPSQPFFERADDRHPPSPLDLLWALDAKTLWIFGDEDVVYPAPVQQDLRRRIEQWQVDVDVRVYPGAPHAFSAPGASFYAEGASRHSWQEALQFVEQHLGR
jgi:carboxymethylenebutenolidase